MNSGGVFCFFCVLAELSWFMQYTVKRISFGDIHSLFNEECYENKDEDAPVNDN